MIALAALILSVSFLMAIVAIEVHGDRVLRSRTRRRVLVTTKTGLWFSGVLFAHDRRSVVLRDASTESEGGGAAMVVDGEVLILTDDIVHIQFP